MNKEKLMEKSQPLVTIFDEDKKLLQQKLQEWVSEEGSELIYGK